jgi:thiamine kinase
VNGAERVTRLLGQFPDGQRALAAGVDCRPVVAGAVNDVFRVVGEAADWAVRIAGPVDAALRVSREAEVEAHRLAAHFGFAPSVVYAAPSDGILVTQWCASPPISSAVFESETGLVRLAQRVRALHGVSPTPRLRPLDVDTLLDGYLTTPVGCASSPVSRTVLRSALRRTVDRRRAPVPVFCHNDLHARNVLDSDPLLFIDWEYAGRGDPLFELAGIVGYHDLGLEQVEALVAGYGDVSAADLRPWQVVFDVVHALWLDAADAWATLDPQRRAALVDRLSA